MKVVMVLLICDRQPSTNVTKNSILVVAGVLDPPLGLKLTEVAELLY